MTNSSGDWKRNKLVRFLILFCVIMAMFFAVEVLPLNFGPKHIPWRDIPSHIRRRLPVVVVIAVAGAAYVVVRNRGNTGEKK